jgi:tetratricopeptide (TPR) repeat protein
MHDLVRSYAACTARHHLDSATRDAALRRMVDFYIHTANVADQVLDPHRPHLELDASVSDVDDNAPSDVPAAMGWFESEHANLVAAQRVASAHDWHLSVWHLARTLSTFQAWRGRHEERLVVRQSALDSAAHLANPALHAHLHRLLGRAYADLGYREDASKHFYQALELAEANNDLTQQAITHLALAWFLAPSADNRFWEQPPGNDQRALDHAGRALEFFGAIGKPVGEAYSLVHMSWVAARLGDPDVARERCHTALSLFRAHHDPAGEADALASMGYIDQHDGQHHRAIHYYTKALELLGVLGNIDTSARILDQLGHPHLALGSAEQARGAWQEALELYRQQGRLAEAECVQRRLEDVDRLS